jgi:F-type H+-transporting ATPase subunit a
MSDITAAAEGAAHGHLSIAERITEAISIKTAFTVRAFGLEVPVSDTVVATWAVMAVLVVGSWLLTRRLREVPTKAQTLVEGFVGFIDDFAHQNLGHHGGTFAAFLGTIFVFLIFANLAPLVTPVGGFGYEPPFIIRPLTRDINVTAGFAVCVIVTVFVSGVVIKGPVGFAKSLVSPMFFMLPFKLMEYLIKPVSLALRLFGNILGAFIIMQLIEMSMPVVLPPILALYFDLFDGLIQAVVFAFLSTVYVAEAIE